MTMTNVLLANHQETILHYVGQSKITPDKLCEAQLTFLLSLIS